MSWATADRVLWDGSRTLLMGILNVTPDSFSDGGDFTHQAQAIEHGRQMAAAGADIIDIGGESTRPGADPVAETEEMDRVLPVVSALAEAGLIVSIDTTKAEVARQAVAAGAAIINDVSGFRDPAMAAAAAETGAAVVVMHMQGEPRTMQAEPAYEDVVAEVSQYLNDQAAALRRAGVAAEAIAIDPGIGFGKTLDHNLSLMAHLPRLVASGYPVVLGTSRKSFLGSLTGHENPVDRDLATAATVVAGMLNGIAVARVHNVALCQEAALVAGAIVGAD